jgi:DNA-binding helix-hairpin-helix protein with protein kinase domain
MDETTSTSHTSAETTTTQQSAMVPPSQPITQQPQVAPDGKSIPESTEVTASEHRQAYGTAKTENLRDSGWWRIVLPVFVALCCLALLAIPLIILVPLFANSLAPDAAANKQGIPLTWVWIVMTIIEIGAAAIIIWGLVKIFMTQAGNYR